MTMLRTRRRSEAKSSPQSAGVVRRRMAHRRVRRRRQGSVPACGGSSTTSRCRRWSGSQGRRTRSWPSGKSSPRTTIRRRHRPRRRKPAQAAPRWTRRNASSLLLPIWCSTVGGHRRRPRMPPRPTARTAAFRSLVCRLPSPRGSPRTTGHCVRSAVSSRRGRLRCSTSSRSGGLLSTTWSGSCASIRERASTGPPTSSSSSSPRNGCGASSMAKTGACPSCCQARRGRHPSRIGGRCRGRRPALVGTCSTPSQSGAAR
mmetsp:Transcript_51779/g.150516  ORF Transcript_51779/g.150516 Transcript_51779/m.150516 type:complete len:259 (+) Transcript_51779:1743-2519(+)